MVINVSIEELEIMLIPNASSLISAILIGYQHKKNVDTLKNAAFNILTMIIVENQTLNMS